MVFVQTTAYNAEKTLRRAVDSILNQTYGDFIYYICDNGSTDKTGEIVDEYAKKDRRIVASHNKRNYDWAENREFLTLSNDLSDDDYFCTLDADDEYEVTFLEDVLRFMDENELDIGCCSIDFINAADNRSLAVRAVESDLIIEGKKFVSHLYIYFQFMRSVWGKLYRGNISRVMVTDKTAVPDFPKYGGDSANVMLSFGASKRVGILSKVLYKYYASPKSVSYNFDEERISDDRKLFERMLDFLRHFNSLTAQNIEFPLTIYLTSICDTLNILLGANISDDKKAAGITDIFSHEYTKRVIAQKDLGSILGVKTDIAAKKQEMYTDTVAAMVDIRNVPNELSEKFFDVGIMLSAELMHAGAFVYFKKLRVEFLLSHHRTPEALAAIEELEEMIPDDADVKVMKLRL
jgi:glycosyltransferase involved in cell wall biosynthesis